MKESKLTLVVPDHNIERDFTFAHAEALLALRNNGGWQLPEGSKYEFKDGVISKRSKGKDKEQG